MIVYKGNRNIMAKKSSALKGLITIGFGITLGSLLATLLFILLAMCLFVPGFIIVYKQNKLPKEKRNTALLVLGFILMGLGVVIGLGFGAGVFFSQLGEEL